MMGYGRSNPTSRDVRLLVPPLDGPLPVTPYLGVPLALMVAQRGHYGGICMARGPPLRAYEGGVKHAISLGPKRALLALKGI